MVLPAQLRKQTPDVHQQGALGEAGEVGLGVSPPPHQARLEVLTNALRHLARKGLTAAAVIANFHRQRVIALTKRNLPIFDLTPEAPASGLRTSLMLLPRDVAARRARNVVAEFPDNPEDLWKIKMCPEAGVPFCGEFQF